MTTVLDVTDIPELFERILVYIPKEYHRYCRSVCRAWWLSIDPIEIRIEDVINRYLLDDEGWDPQSVLPSYEGLDQYYSSTFLDNRVDVVKFLIINNWFGIFRSLFACIREEFKNEDYSNRNIFYGLNRLVIKPVDGFSHYKKFLNYFGMVVTMNFDIYFHVIKRVVESSNRDDSYTKFSKRLDVLYMFGVKKDWCPETILRGIFYRCRKYPHPPQMFVNRQYWEADLWLGDFVKRKRKLLKEQGWKEDYTPRDSDEDIDLSLFEMEYG